MKNFKRFMSIVALSISIPLYMVFAHSGGTDKNGCHWKYSANGTRRYNYHQHDENGVDIPCKKSPKKASGKKKTTTKRKSAPKKKAVKKKTATKMKSVARKKSTKPTTVTKRKAPKKKATSKKAPSKRTSAAKHKAKK